MYSKKKKKTVSYTNCSKQSSKFEIKNTTHGIQITHTNRKASAIAAAPASPMRLFFKCNEVIAVLVLSQQSLKHNYRHDTDDNVRTSIIEVTDKKVYTN